MQKTIQNLSIIVALTTIVSAVIGLFYSNGGLPLTVQSIYGQQVTLYGDGIYSYNSLLKVGATKGTDIVMILVSLILLLTIVMLQNKAYTRLLQTGLLSCLLYSSTCLVMGVSFNRLFLIYLLQFSSALFAFILSLSNLLSQDCFQVEIYDKTLKGTTIFLMISGSSVLIWLIFIIPAIITGTPSEFIEIYTTEPTFVIDLGIILPMCIATGIGLLKHKKTAYVLASVLMTLLTSVGVCVIFQTIVQLQLDIVLEIGQMIGLVISFVILGAIATIFNYKLLKHTK
jgi:hypothetical protein